MLTKEEAIELDKEISEYQWSKDEKFIQGVSSIVVKDAETLTNAKLFYYSK